jgi:CheY-like chemotaxis protein
MTDDLFSLRLLVVSKSQADQDLFRRAASAARIPIEIAEAEDAVSARRLIAAGIDLAFLDTALGDEAIEQLAAAARATAKPPFTVLLCGPDTAAPFPTDALATRPSDPEDAKRLMDGTARVRLTTRVLVLDDSATMRSIVRKILAGTRFPLEVTEAEQGSQAIELARKIDFDIIFLDYNLPGFSGLETMAELKREKRNAIFVLITSTQDNAVGLRARALGAAFLKKPFFPADIEAVLCGFYGLRALNPKRA